MDPTHRFLSIFVLHPSDVLTDHIPNGDGLIAFGFLSELAARGHRLHVAFDSIDLKQPLPTNVTLHHIDLRAPSKLLRRFEYALKVRLLYNDLARKERFDIVHQMNPVHTGLNVMMLGIPVPVTLGTFVPRWPYDCDDKAPTEKNEPIANRIKTALQNVLLLAQQRISAGLIVVAPPARNRLACADLFEEKIFQVRHGVDTTLFAPRRRISGAEDTILFLANLGTRKGIFTLLEAFEQVSSLHPTAKLIVAGSGYESAAIEATIATMPSRSHIEFLGNVRRRDVPELMSRAAVYCLPSHGEPYATSIIEAMSCGLAIVGTQAGGTPYLVPPTGGILVGVRDAASLATALLVLLKDPAATAEMGRENRSYVMSTHAWPVVVESLEHVFDAVIRRYKAPDGPNKATS